MQIYKFGGSSLESAKRISQVARIVSNQEEKIVVLSANGKSTDYFATMGQALLNKHFEGALKAKNHLTGYYFSLIDDLYDAASYHTKAKEYIFQVFRSIYNRFDRFHSENQYRWLLSRGEMISTVLFSLYLESNSTEHHFIFASDIIFKDKNGEIDSLRTKRELNKFMKLESRHPLFLTQGFLCSGHDGLPDTLGRGGSDYTAAILGQACNASVIQIWSDVDGFLNNDPSQVTGALPLKNLSFDEAEELAYFGARILHPMTLTPAKNAEIPVLLKNTLNPKAQGTLISGTIQAAGIKAAAAKDGICLIHVHSARMLMATGFLKNVFEVFEKYKTSVDMVTTSEVSISLTIDNPMRLEEILAALARLGQVSYQKDLSIICVVGDQLAENRGKVDQLFSTLKNIPIRMISYGAARNSISMLVETENKVQALESLNPVILKNIIPAPAHV